VEKGCGDEEVYGVALLDYLLSLTTNDKPRGIEGNFAQISIVATIIGKATPDFGFADVPADLLVGLF
jgi:hypothetical protein